MEAVAKAAAERAEGIDRRWVAVVGENQGRIDSLAKHLMLWAVRRPTWPEQPVPLPVQLIG